MDSITSREMEIGRIVRSADRIAALQKHLKEIIQGRAFKGSLRSAQFLTYIVQQAIAGNFESLKERLIGAELFQRSPSYDTGEDAIVRVTASDVRKRLLQHYDRYGSTSDIHIGLPLGSYIPEITWDGASGTSPLDPIKMHQVPVLTDLSPANGQEYEPRSSETPFQVAIAQVARGAETASSRWRVLTVLFAALAVMLAVVNLAPWGAMRKATLQAKTAPDLVLPWRVLFNSPNATHLITSDVDIVRLQRLDGSRISVSDYANRKYFPQDNTLTADDKTYLMEGDKSATLDTQITASIAELAGARSHKIDVKGARDVKFSDLKTDDNFIFLGSPFSDPWVTVFNDHLDFQFIASGEAGLGIEAIRNIHPGSNEQSIYSPTAIGGATGESYAIVALVGNPGQYGQILLLAGVSGEGTEAAGRLVSDLPRLSLALQKCGISSPGPLKHFEMMLRVNLMAGSPSEYDVVACHILADTPIQVP